MKSIISCVLVFFIALFATNDAELEKDHEEIAIVDPYNLPIPNEEFHGEPLPTEEEVLSEGLLKPVVLKPITSSPNKEDRFSVELDAWESTTLSAQVSMPVIKIHKQMGESFQMGEPLINLDDTIAQSKLKKAEVVLNRNLVDVKSKRNLYEKKMISHLEIYDAEAALATAQLEYVTAKKELEYCTILAPYSGKVNIIFIELFELPQLAQGILEIIDDKQLKARILVPSTYRDKVNIGQTISIDIKDIQKTITGTIMRISSIIDPSSGTFKIEAKIDNREGLLIAGMTGWTTLKEQ